MNAQVMNPSHADRGGLRALAGPALALLRRIRRQAPSAARWLPRDGTLSLRPGRAGLEILGQRGLVLVTQEGDAIDHVVGPGERFRASGRGRVAVWALASASFAVIGRPGAEGSSSR